MEDSEEYIEKNCILNKRTITTITEVVYETSRLAISGVVARVSKAAQKVSTVHLVMDSAMNNREARPHLVRS